MLRPRNSEKAMQSRQALKPSELSDHLVGLHLLEELPERTRNQPVRHTNNVSRPTRLTFLSLVSSGDTTTD